MHVIAAKAVALKEALTPEFKEYQKKIISNAKTLAQELTCEGFRIVAGGTDTHLLLVDLTDKDMTGKEAAAFLDQARITVNKNLIPYDKKSPFLTSGIRLGTPAVTTRGMGLPEMKKIASIIADCIIGKGAPQVIEDSKKKVGALVKKFPLYKPLLKEFKV